MLSEAPECSLSLLSPSPTPQSLMDGGEVEQLNAFSIKSKVLKHDDYIDYIEYVVDAE